MQKAFTSRSWDIHLTQAMYLQPWTQPTFASSARNGRFNRAKIRVPRAKYMFVLLSECLVKCSVWKLRNNFPALRNYVKISQCPLSSPEEFVGLSKVHSCMICRYVSRIIVLLTHGATQSPDKWLSQVKGSEMLCYLNYGTVSFFGSCFYKRLVLWLQWWNNISRLYTFEVP